MKSGEKIVGWFESYLSYERVSKEMIESMGESCEKVFETPTDVKYASHSGYLEIQATLTRTHIRWRYTNLYGETPNIIYNMCCEIQPSQEEVEDWILTTE